MACIINLWKKYKKEKETTLISKSYCESNSDSEHEYEPKINNYNSISYIGSLNKQNECCICYNKLDELQLSCGHNMHIRCIFKFIILTPSIRCPLCFICRKIIYKDCIKHIKTCKNKECECKKIKLNEEDIVIYILNNDIINIHDENEFIEYLQKNNIDGKKYIDKYKKLNNTN